MALAWTATGETWQVTGKDLYEQGATLTVGGSVIDDVNANGEIGRAHV